MLKQDHQDRPRSGEPVRTRQWFASLALLMLASVANAQTVELDRFVLDLADDWTIRSRTTDTVHLTIAGADHQPELAFTTRKLDTGSPAQILRDWFRSLKPAPRSRRLTVRSGRLSNGVAAWLLEPGETSGPVRLALAIEKQENLLLASLTAQAASANGLAADLGAMLLSATDSSNKPSNEPSATSNWPTPSRKLSGFYATIGSNVSLSLLARTRHLIGINGLLLADDGRFALTETAMGSTPAQACEKQPMTCGHYDATEARFSGWRSTSPLEHQLGFLRGEERSLVTEADGTLIIGGVRYQRIEANATSLDGRYRSASTSQVDGQDGERLNAYREILFTFAPDGTFEQSELKALTRASTGTPLSLSSAPAPKRGEYRITDFALELNYADAASVTYPMFLMQQVPVINGSMYKLLRPVVATATADGIKSDK